MGFCAGKREGRRGDRIWSPFSQFRYLGDCGRSQALDRRPEFTFATKRFLVICCGGPGPAGPAESGTVGGGIGSAIVVAADTWCALRRRACHPDVPPPHACLPRLHSGCSFLYFPRWNVFVHIQDKQRLLLSPLLRAPLYSQHYPQFPKSVCPLPRTSLSVPRRASARPGRTGGWRHIATLLQGLVPGLVHLCAAPGLTLGWLWGSFPVYYR